jgi:hypothetical protein
MQANAIAAGDPGSWRVRGLGVTDVLELALEPIQLR